MYELEEKKKQGHWKTYQKATEHFLDHDYIQALSLLQNFYNENPQDGPTQHLLKICESKL